MKAVSYLLYSFIISTFIYSNNDTATLTPKKLSPKRTTRSGKNYGRRKSVAKPASKQKKGGTNGVTPSDPKGSDENGVPTNVPTGRDGEDDISAIGKNGEDFHDVSATMSELNGLN